MKPHTEAQLIVFSSFPEHEGGSSVDADDPSVSSDSGSDRRLSSDDRDSDSAGGSEQSPIRPPKPSELTAAKLNTGEDVPLCDDIRGRLPRDGVCLVRVQSRELRRLKRQRRLQTDVLARTAMQAVAVAHVAAFALKIVAAFRAKLHVRRRASRFRQCSLTLYIIATVVSSIRSSSHFLSRTGTPTDFPGRDAGWGFATTGRPCCLFAAIPHSSRASVAGRRRPHGGPQLRPLHRHPGGEVVHQAARRGRVSETTAAEAAAKCQDGSRGNGVQKNEPPVCVNVAVGRRRGRPLTRIPSYVLDSGAQ
jgi:hypothetical protein